MLYESVRDGEGREGRAGGIVEAADVKADCRYKGTCVTFGTDQLIQRGTHVGAFALHRLRRHRRFVPRAPFRSLFPPLVFFILVFFSSFPPPSPPPLCFYTGRRQSNYPARPG